MARDLNHLSPHFLRNPRNYEIPLFLNLIYQFAEMNR